MPLSLWLVPDAAHAPLCADAVARASAAAGAPPFDAHVTLLTLASGADAAAALAAAEALARSAAGPLRVGIAGVEAGAVARHWKYRCVFLRVAQPDAPLDELNARARLTLPAVDDEPFMAHLSLCYSECDAAARAAVRDASAAALGALARGLVLDRLQLRDCTSADTAAWRVLGDFALGARE